VDDLRLQALRPQRGFDPPATEPAIAEANSSDVMQFERLGYFTRDPDSTPVRPVLNRTIGLRDTFAKEVVKG